MGILTPSGKIIKWIEKYCRIPEGDFVGQPIKLRKWQKDIINGIYNGGPTRRVIISVGRKNGKSALAALLCLVHLVGPRTRPNSQLYSTALSRDQAAILFNLAAKMVRMSPSLNKHIIIRDSAKELVCPARGTKYKALSAEASTAYGLSPVFVVHDELGQIHGPRSELYEAMETATAAHQEPLSIIISTQAPTDADLLSILIDDAKDETDPRVKLFLYTASVEADPFARRTIQQANPAFGDFQNAEEVLAMAQDAKRMPSRENEYRNLILNQRVETNDPYVSPAVWKINGGAPLEDWAGLNVYCGLDLSESRDLTAFVMVARKDGVLHVKPFFWLPGDGLRARAESDRVPYDLWHKQGHLMTSPGNTVEYEFVAEYLRGVFDQYDIRKVAFDRWNWKHFKPWLDRAGFSETEIEDRFEEFGQGYQSMSPALRDLDSALLNSNMRHGMHPVLSMCAANAIVKSSPTNDRKLAKLTTKHRIDGMIALTMAVSVLARDEPDAPRISIYSRQELWESEGEDANA